MHISKTLIFCFFVFFHINSFSASIEIFRHPDAIPFPAATPFEVMFSEPLSDGDEFFLYTNENKVAIKLSVNGKIKIDKISSRYKAFSNKTKISVFDHGKEVDNKYIEFDLAGDQPFLDDSSDVNDNSICVVKPLEEFKMLCRSKMAKTGYVRKVVYSNDEGYLVLEMTPYAAQNPFFSFHGNFETSSIVTKAYKATNKYLDSGSIENSELAEILVSDKFPNSNQSSGWVKSN